VPEAKDLKDPPVELSLEAGPVGLLLKENEGNITGNTITRHKKQYDWK